MGYDSISGAGQFVADGSGQFGEAIPSFASHTFLPITGEFASVRVTTDTHDTSTAPITFNINTSDDIAALRARTQEFLQRDPATPGARLAFRRGDAVMDSGFFRVDPRNAARYQIPIDSLVCFPADPADASKLAPHNRRFPVALIIHGQHPSIQDFTPFTRTGPAVPRVIGGVARPVTPCRADGVGTRVANHEGYRYLQEDLAAMGVVSISIDTNPANFFGSLLQMRAEMIFANLDHLRRLSRTSSSRFHRKLDFRKVALIGHSRGGDAVVLAENLNRRRSSSRRFGIKSVISIAPTDLTGALQRSDRLRVRNSDLLILYGSHDGDVTGFDGNDRFGTGFRHYDRNGARRAMVFLHGCTHNRFNSVWNEIPGHFDFFHRAADRSDARMISVADHQQAARDYVSGWLAKSFYNDNTFESVFDGRDPNSRGVPFSLQWKTGSRTRTIDFFDDSDDSRNQLGGSVTPSAFTSEVFLPSQGQFQFPHQDRALKGTVVSLLSSGPYRTEIPSGNQNFTRFELLTFRLTRRFDVSSLAAVAADPFPLFSIRIEDRSGGSATVDAATIFAANPLAPTRPYFRQMTHRITGVTRNITKNNMETITAPLSLFTGVALTRVRAVEILFDSSRADEIYFDTLTLIRR